MYYVTLSSPRQHYQEHIYTSLVENHIVSAYIMCFIHRVKVGAQSLSSISYLGTMPKVLKKFLYQPPNQMWKAQD